MAATATTYDAVLAELWPRQRVANMAFEGSAFLAMCQKNEDFTEKTKHIAFRFGNNQGRSATFADAQANVGSTQLGEFALTIISDYAVGVVDGLTLERTKSNKAALLNAVEEETRGALEELMNTLSFDLWNSGTGARGTVGSGEGTTDITLTDTNDVINFEVGMEIEAAATETGALRVGTATVTGVDFTDGIITTDSNWSAQIASLAATDFLFVEGDSAETGANKKVSGVPAWIPVADPTSTAFFGLDRTTHITRMGGNRHTGTGDGTIMEAIKNLAAKVARRSGRRAKPDIVWMSALDLDNLDIELGSNKRYVQVEAPIRDSSGKTLATVGFDAIEFSTPLGRIKAMQDQFIPVGSAWLTQMDTWTCHSLGMLPRIIQHDGSKIDRQATADGVEFRAVYRAQLACDAPGWNGYVSLPT